VSHKLCDCGTCKRCLHRADINRWNARHPEALAAIRTRSEAKRRARSDYKEKRQAEYQAHRPSYLARASKQQETNRAINNKYVTDYLFAHPCIDCGEANIILLDFDHVRGKKLLGVSQLMNRILKHVIAEIEKCEVRCVGCHRLKTSKEQNTFRFQLTSV
jgi:DNA-directed RNA polymerase beta subunit